MLRRNCVVMHLVEGKTDGRMDVTGRRGIRSKQLLDDRKEMRGYWSLEDEALDHTV